MSISVNIVKAHCSATEYLPTLVDTQSDGYWSYAPRDQAAVLTADKGDAKPVYAVLVISTARPRKRHTGESDLLNAPPSGSLSKADSDWQKVWSKELWQLRS